MPYVDDAEEERRLGDFFTLARSKEIPRFYIFVNLLLGIYFSLMHKMPTSLELIVKCSDTSITKFLQDNGFQIRNPLENRLIAIGVLYTYGFIIQSDWRYIIDSRFNNLMLMSDNQLSDMIRWKCCPNHNRMSRIKYIIDDQGDKNDMTLRELSSMDISAVHQQIKEVGLSETGDHKEDRYKLFFIVHLSNRLRANDAELLMLRNFRDLWLLPDDKLIEIAVKHGIFDTRDSIEIIRRLPKDYRAPSPIRCYHQIKDIVDKPTSLFVTKGDSIGEGESGDVFIACCDDNCDFVVKKANPRDETPKNFFINELKASLIASDYGIGPKIYDYTLNGEYTIVMEKMDKTLYKYMEPSFERPLDKFRFITLANTNYKGVTEEYDIDIEKMYPDIYNEIKFLVDKFALLGYYHGDFHSNNIMVMEINGVVNIRIIDYGLLSSKRPDNMDDYVNIKDIKYERQYSKPLMVSKDFKYQTDEIKGLKWNHYVIKNADDAKDVMVTITNSRKVLQNIYKIYSIVIWITDELRKTGDQCIAYISFGVDIRSGKILKSYDDRVTPYMQEYVDKYIKPFVKGRISTEYWHVHDYKDDI